MLAGGAGRRLGSAGASGGPGAGAPSKAVAKLAGRPLVAYPLAALAEVCARLAVICKRATVLPAIGAAERWEEPDEPRHPLTGIVHALEHAQAPVLVCAADMPFVTPDVLRALVDAPADPPAVVAATERGLEPLLALYRPAALPCLHAAPQRESLRATVAGLDPVLVPVAERVARSVNTPADLATAEAELGARATAGERA